MGGRSLQRTVELVDGCHGDGWRGCWGGGGEVWSCGGRLCGGGGGVEVPRPPGYEANLGESEEIGDTATCGFKSSYSIYTGIALTI